MEQILADKTKFVCDTTQKDMVQVIEKEITMHLKELVKKGILDNKTFSDLVPQGSITPRLYGLPKTHKTGIPLRPILSMVGSPYHKLAQWLTQLLQSIRSKMAVHTLKDSFQFVELYLKWMSKNKVMASLDVESLFTNVPLNEVIDIIFDYAAENSIKVGIQLVDLCKLISICTKNIQFLFNGRYYHQIDGVAMGSPLGPVLADIFMAHLEQRASNIITKMSFYKRYVDDIFVVCESAEGIQRCTWSIESDTSKHKVHFRTRVSKLFTILRCFTNSTWRWFYSKEYISQENMERSVHTFQKFCSNKSQTWTSSNTFWKGKKVMFRRCHWQRIVKLHEILQQNGYPKRFIAKYSICKSNKQSNYSVAKTDVYITLPYKGDDVTTLIKRRLNSAIKRTYNTANLVFVERPMHCPPHNEKTRSLVSPPPHVFTLLLYLWMQVHRPYDKDLMHSGRRAYSQMASTEENWGPKKCNYEALSWYSTHCWPTKRFQYSISGKK